MTDQYLFTWIVRLQNKNESIHPFIMFFKLDKNKIALCEQGVQQDSPGAASKLKP